MATNSRKMFVNLPVKDLKRSMDFFIALGFTFKFNDDKAACMIMSEDAFVMLMTEPFFKTFTRREICNTDSQLEGMFGVFCGSREEVDQMVKGAIASGGKHAGDATDHGFMYGWSFYDLDGHVWVPTWMDPAAMM